MYQIVANLIGGLAILALTSLFVSSVFVARFWRDKLSEIEKTGHIMIGDRLFKVDEVKR